MTLMITDANDGLLCPLSFYRKTRKKAQKHILILTQLVTTIRIHLLSLCIRYMAPIRPEYHILDIDFFSREWP